MEGEHSPSTTLHNCPLQEQVGWGKAVLHKHGWFVFERYYKMKQCNTQERGWMKGRANPLKSKGGDLIKTRSLIRVRWNKNLTHWWIIPHTLMLPSTPPPRYNLICFSFHPSPIQCRQAGEGRLDYWARYWAEPRAGAGEENGPWCHGLWSAYM